MNQINETLDPAIIVIFGMTGDLSQRYLLPGLYNLIKDNLLNPETEIIGVSRTISKVDEIFDKLSGNLQQSNNYDEQALNKMRECTSMFQMDLDNPEGYNGLLQKLNGIEDEKGVCMDRLFYLSIPPAAYSSVIALIGERKLNAGCQHNKASSRLLVEKPFGFDLKSAEALIEETSKVFSEEQIFRIDHYMAKETVQNVLTFRFQNTIFESLWNNQYISSIEISAKEKLGIEGRAVFYEPMGALRDFIQSHLIQILGIITMDRPDTLDSGPIHANKQAILENVEILSPDMVSQAVVRGQYEGYKEEVNNLESTTETYAAITLNINSPRWQGVPITLLTGKSLDERKTQVSIKFKSREGMPSDKLNFRIQPNEGIELDLITKKPGYDYEAEVSRMDFSYNSGFPNDALPDAYQRVLVDAIRGDHTLFATSQEVLSAWRIVQPVLDAWANNSERLLIYPPGSTGPEQAT